MKASTLLLFLFLTVFTGDLHAQHHDPTPDHEFRNIRISTIILHTYIPTETVDGPELLIIPTFGLDIEYWFNPHWAIGLHNDIELESFEIKTAEGEFIERQFPVVLTLDAIWKPRRYWVLLAGPGYEITPEENFAVFRMGMEFEYEISHWLDISPNVMYDIRDNAFDTFSYGLGVGFRF